MQRRTFLQVAIALAVMANSAGRALAATRRPTGLIYSDLYLRHMLDIRHPESPRRLESLMALFREQAWFEQLEQIQPWPDPGAALASIHTREHIESIKKHYPQSHTVALAAAGGAIAAIDAVMAGDIRNAFCASRPPGHHALNTGREEGFCFYNSIAIAARHLQSAHALERILIVDWDYHHGNGTEAAFYDDPSVLFFSTHDINAYPGTGHSGDTGSGAGKGYTINVPLGCGATDADIIAAFRDRLVPAVSDFKPEFILISAGFDSRESDLLGCYDITDAGFAELTRMMLELADRHCEGRVVSILEGGYNLQGNASAAAAHVGELVAG